MELTERLIKGISLGIKNALNEAGRISHRTIDRKLWLSVASVCSRNRSTEAEFVKPMKKLTKDDLLNRYVAALLITKKPCPKSENDIEKNKTLKLFAQKALLLGATFEDIQNLYDANKGKVGSAVASSTLDSEITLQTVREPLKDMESLSNKDLQGKYLYRYYTSYGFGYGSSGFSVGVRDLGDDERRFVLGTYLMSNDKFDIFVSEYLELITKSGSRWDMEVAGKKTLGKPGMKLKYIPKMYETLDDALEDYNGMENTAVCTLFSGGVFPFSFTFNKVVHSSYGWDDSYLRTKSGYIPALGELMYAFKFSNLLKDVKGLVWSSTFKDPTHVYASNGKSIQVLDLEKDSAYLVPFIPIEKGKTRFSYELEQEHFPGLLDLNKDDFIKQDKGNYLQLAKAWQLNINQSEYDAIAKRAKLMSNRELESLIINLLKKGVGNSNRSDGEKGFYKKEMYNNHWNMLIEGLVYWKNKLFVKYWTGGDLTDSSDWINVDDLIGTHTDTTAKTRFSFDAKAKNEILMTAYTLLTYWDKLIKKYS